MPHSTPCPRIECQRRYKPSALISFSIVIHVVVLASVVVKPHLWSFGLGILLLDHLVLTLLGMWSKSTALGPNRIRQSSAQTDTIYLTFDDGPEPLVTPKVLDLLDTHGYRATFFVIGSRAKAYPALMREILERGHGIGNHSHFHRIGFAMQGYRGFVEELNTAQREIHGSTGVWCRLFRAPFGIRSPILEAALCRTGLTLVSWTRRGYDTRCRSPETVLKRLVKGMSAGDILLLHDGQGGAVDSGDPMVLKVLPRLLAEMKKRSLRSEALPDFR